MPNYHKPLKNKTMLNLIFLFISCIILFICGMQLIKNRTIQKAVFIDLIISLTIFILTLKF